MYQGIKLLPSSIISSSPLITSPTTATTTTTTTTTSTRTMSDELGKAVEAFMNAASSSLPPASASSSLPVKYIGTRHRGGKWGAETRLPNRERLWLGTFKTEKDAAVAYDVAAYRLRGDLAVLNFPSDRHDTSIRASPFNSAVEARLQGHCETRVPSVVPPVTSNASSTVAMETDPEWEQHLEAMLSDPAFDDFL